MSTACAGTWPTGAVRCQWHVIRSGNSKSSSISVGPMAWNVVESRKRLLPSQLSCSSRLPMEVYASYPWSIARTAFCNMKSDPQVLRTWSMEKTYDVLAHRLLEATRTVDQRSKYIVGLAGPPGSGKSTVANEVVSRLNSLWRVEKSMTDEAMEMAVAVPMDGFHLYRWQLDAMNDPAEAHARRGAPWTFDPVSLVDCLGTLRKKGRVSFPSFDHGMGDPVEDDIYVEDKHKVILVEGNYLLLTEGAWNDLGNIFDERWFVQVDLDEAMRRIETRHVLTGKPPDVAKRHVAYNDRPNAELVQESRWTADLWIQSIPLTIADPIFGF